jgi:hypothetical protein
MSGGFKPQRADLLHGGNDRRRVNVGELVDELLDRPALKSSPASTPGSARQPVAHSGKARKVAVVADDCGAVFDGEGCEMRVGREVPRGAALAQESSEEAGMPHGRLSDYSRRGAEPRFDLRDRLIDGHRRRENGPVRADADERQQRDPGQSDSLDAPERRVQPGPRLLVMGACAVNRVQQDVGVDDDQGR